MQAFGRNRTIQGGPGQTRDSFNYKLYIMWIVTISLFITAYSLWRSAMTGPDVTPYFCAVVISLLALASLFVAILPSRFFDYTEDR